MKYTFTAKASGIWDFSWISTNFWNSTALQFCSGTIWRACTMNRALLASFFLFSNPIETTKNTITWIRKIIECRYQQPSSTSPGGILRNSNKSTLNISRWEMLLAESNFVLGHGFRLHYSNRYLENRTLFRACRIIGFNTANQRKVESIGKCKN